MLGCQLVVGLDAASLPFHADLGVVGVPYHAFDFIVFPERSGVLLFLLRVGDVALGYDIAVKVGHRESVRAVDLRASDHVIPERSVFQFGVDRQRGDDVRVEFGHLHLVVSVQVGPYFQRNLLGRIAVDQVLARVVFLDREADGVRVRMSRRIPVVDSVGEGQLSGRFPAFEQRVARVIGRSGRFDGEVRSVSRYGLSQGELQIPFPARRKHAFHDIRARRKELHQVVVVDAGRSCRHHVRIRVVLNRIDVDQLARSEPVMVVVSADRRQGDVDGALQREGHIARNAFRIGIGDQDAVLFRRGRYDLADRLGVERPFQGYGVLGYVRSLLGNYAVAEGTLAVDFQFVDSFEFVFRHAAFLHLSIDVLRHVFPEEVVFDGGTAQILDVSLDLAQFDRVGADGIFYPLDFEVGHVDYLILVRRVDQRYPHDGLLVDSRAVVDLAARNLRRDRRSVDAGELLLIGLVGSQLVSIGCQLETELQAVCGHFIGVRPVVVATRHHAGQVERLVVLDALGDFFGLCRTVDRSVVRKMMMRAVCTIEIGNLLRIIELRGDNGRYGRLSEPDIFGVDVGFGLVLEQTVVRYGHFQRDGIDLVSVELQRLGRGLGRIDGQDAVFDVVADDFHRRIFPRFGGSGHGRRRNERGRSDILLLYSGRIQAIIGRCRLVGDDRGFRGFLRATVRIDRQGIVRYGQELDRGDSVDIEAGNQRHARQPG